MERRRPSGGRLPLIAALEGFRRGVEDEIGLRRVASLLYDPGSQFAGLLRQHLLAPRLKTVADLLQQGIHTGEMSATLDAEATVYAMAGSYFARPRGHRLRGAQLGARRSTDCGAVVRVTLRFRRPTSPVAVAWVIRSTMLLRMERRSGTRPRTPKPGQQGEYRLPGRATGVDEPRYRRGRTGHALRRD